MLFFMVIGYEEPCRKLWAEQALFEEKMLLLCKSINNRWIIQQQ